MFWKVSMVLHETQSLLQSVLGETVLTACRQTLALLYQNELVVEGSISVILDKQETILVKINNSCNKKEEENVPQTKCYQEKKTKEVTTPKRKRGRPPKPRPDDGKKEIKKHEKEGHSTSDDENDHLASGGEANIKNEPSEISALPTETDDPQMFKDIVVNSSLSELHELASQLAEQVDPADNENNENSDSKQEISEESEAPGAVEGGSTFNGHHYSELSCQSNLAAH